MIHARSDYNAIQPWPTKRAHIAKQNGNTVHVPIDEPGWAGIDTEVQLRQGRVQPIIPDDEPVLLIRGQDLAAIPAGEAWCKAARELGADESLVAAVEQHLELIRAWQTEHAKVPDAPAEVLGGELPMG